MTSLTQLCRDLSIGKPRLYGILERLDIQPEQVGNKRLLDNDQVTKVRDALESKTVRDRPRPTAHNGSEGNKDELVATRLIPSGFTTKST